MPKKTLSEGLKANDLEGFVSETFTVDRYKSKMGDDADIIVLGFRVKEKYPAIDLMEFIEKGYEFVLDADISSGEEYGGDYQVFVELERTPKFPKNLKELLEGIGRLTDCYDWRFRYQKSKTAFEFTNENIMEHIPLNALDYKRYMLEQKQKDIQEFFDMGATSITVDENNNMTFSKPFSNDISAKFIAIGDYEAVKDQLPGALDLSESGQGEVLFLTKYLGNYDINKIGNKFIIRNSDQAIIIEKDRW